VREGVAHRGRSTVSGAPRALARRYARALLDVVSTQEKAVVLGLRDELRSFVQLVAGHAELQRALVDPALAPEAKQRLVRALLERAGGSALLGRLVELLRARDRMALLPDVAESYAVLANAAQGVVSAEAFSAVVLPEAQRTALAEALGGRRAGVELRTQVDPALVGGLLVRVGGRTYDGSVRTQLAALRRRLASAGPGASSGAS
jgi:F-type H+-transporting ATPase subunit delta